MKNVFKLRLKLRINNQITLIISYFSNNCMLRHDQSNDLAEQDYWCLCTYKRR